MTVSKCGRVPKTIKIIIQESFTRMDDTGYSTFIKWNKSESVNGFTVFRNLAEIIYSFSVYGEDIHYSSYDTNTCKTTQIVLPNSEDAFFQFMFQCDLPLDFDAFNDIVAQIKNHNLEVVAFYKNK